MRETGAVGQTRADDPRSATVLVSTGDVSGDRNAGALVRALRRRRPELRFVGSGGAELEKAGVELIVDQREFSVGGFLSVAGSAVRLLLALRRLGRALRATRPALVVLVDYGGFNLRFARRAQRSGVPVLYYVSPQVWAWRRYRLRQIARRVDRVAAILPFEPEVYAGTGLRVDFVGHPLVEPIRRFAAGCDRDAARRALGLGADATCVVLLPGSRRFELENMLPVHLEAARRLHARHPHIHFALALANADVRARVEAHVARAALPASLRIDRFEGRTREAIRAADVAVATPGTVTLEVALLGCPLVVAGRTNPLEAAIARRLLHIPALAMPNLIAGQPIVPELLQEQARPESVARAVETLLIGPAREAQLARLADVRARLGAGDAAERAAEIAEEMLVEAGRS
ncbi:MAG: lipid-A-disaccharide synthase [Deltaproteobacteria bacterium]|nr:MAG: lipid-A-disaccharide synthase [Deltaproteobacteria bacterium]